ncbi:MAG: hypothetical protein EHM23_27995 [Acidobacteria bacterium]|nr:MAG: hypothetical protein EHM23_27995 [Acidobacteriota bacterium]
MGIFHSRFHHAQFFCKGTAGSRLELHTIRRFLQLESAGGIVLMATAVLGLVCANSPLAELYEESLDAEMSVRLGTLGIAKPSLLWINDGLMAIFFLLVGLEIRREILEGELSSPFQLGRTGNPWKCRSDPPGGASPGASAGPQNGPPTGPRR